MSAKDLLKLSAFDPSNAQTYEALCHCGTVQYTVSLSPPLAQQKVIECNCSICARNSYLLVYPEREYVSIKKGEDALKTYTFGPKMNQHKFCGRCGSSVFFDPRLKERGEKVDLMGINVRMFKGVDMKKLDLLQVDGWNQHPFVESEYLK